MFWNKLDYNKQAKKIINSPTIGYEEIRELLILTTSKTCDVADNFFKKKVQNDDIEALEYLIKICSDMDDFGDAPMQACYYLKDYRPNLLKPFEHLLADTFLNDEMGGRNFLAIALGKIKSERVKKYIYDLSSDEERFGNWIFVEATKLYESP